MGWESVIMRDESDDYKLPADDSIRVEREMKEINKKKKREKIRALVQIT